MRVKVRFDGMGVRNDTWFDLPSCNDKCVQPPRGAGAR